MTLNKAYYIRFEIDSIKKQIESLEEFDVEKKIKLVNKLKRYQSKYIDQLDNINQFIESIEDDETRLIARYRLIDNLKWEEIGSIMYKDRTSCYRKLQKVIKKTQKTQKNSSNM